MLERLITWSLYHRLAVLAGAVLIGVLGILALGALNIDAFPDTTPVQVQINTQAPALVPDEVERQITFPVELAMSGLAGLHEVRSISMFGLSQVVVTFNDGVDIDHARNLIDQRLNALQMPPGIDRPQMGPPSTGLGEVFHYLLVPQDEPTLDEQHGHAPDPAHERRMRARRKRLEDELTALRIKHDWEVKPEMRSVPGTAEVNSWGGFEKQYQVRIDPLRLLKYNLAFDQVMQAVRDNNLNVGGGNINQSGDMLLVHGRGRTMTTEQIGNIVITANEGRPIYVKDVAEVTVGHQIRRGAVTATVHDPRNPTTLLQGEVVLGLGFMLMGENSYAVTQRMREKFDALRPKLPTLLPVTTPFGLDDDVATAVTIDPTGRVVTAGYSRQGKRNEFAMARYLPGGTLDTTLATDGTMTLPLGTGDAEARGVAITAQGKIVAVGSAIVDGRRQAALVRWNDDGSLDSAFGHRGHVLLPLGSGDAALHAVVALPDGKLLAAGSAQREGRAAPLVVRLLGDGRPDTSFGRDGLATLPDEALRGTLYGLAVAHQGLIVAAGSVATEAKPDADFAAFRWLPTGAPDLAFGRQGLARLAIGPGDDLAYALAVQSDGRVLLAGAAPRVAKKDFALARLQADGQVDYTFGREGFVSTVLGPTDDEARGVAVLGDGKIVAAGGSFDGQHQAFALARYLPNGTLDESFGDGGRVRTDVGQHDDTALALALSPEDGKIVVAGSASDGSANNFAVVRYDARGALDATFMQPDLQVVTAYDRTELVDRVIATVKNNLLEGACLVVLILFVFLGNLRAGLICATAIPLSMLFGFCGMWWAGIAGSLLSLGAIDFGVVVDSSVVVIENAVKRLGHAGAVSGRARLEVIRQAAVEVRTPTVFGQLIIMIVYIPILTLEGVEGKMFRPMALTVIFILVGSLVSSLTLTPVLASLVLPKKVHEEDVLLVRLAKRIYRPLLAGVMRGRWAVAAAALAALALTGWQASRLGTEFVPRLSEGAIVVGVIRPPGTSLDESLRINQMMEEVLLTRFPDEVECAWSRAGSPEVPTDAATVEVTDLFVTLKPREQWTKARNQSELVALMDEELKDCPGQVMWFTQPIEQRINEMVSGARGDIAIKLFGEDFDTLVTTAREVERVLRAVPGCRDLSTEQMLGQPILRIDIDQEEIARYGVPAQKLLDIVESVGSKQVGDVVEGTRRFPLAVRLPDDKRDSAEAIRSILVASPTGERIPLSMLAKVEIQDGPRLIAREWSKRRILIQCNVRDRDVGSFVAEAQQAIADKVRLPDEYRLEWGGQFENMQRAQARLKLVVPLALAMIVGLLYLSFRTGFDTFTIFSSVPFACTGGIVALALREMPLSISAAVGFITLSGISVLNSMVLVSALRRELDAGHPLPRAIEAAAIESLRTILMTALVASIGFVPMATSDGAGAEVQRPLASVVIGGIITSTLFTLLVLPILYAWFGRAKPAPAASPADVSA